VWSPHVLHDLCSNPSCWNLLERRYFCVVRLQAVNRVMRTLKMNRVLLDCEVQMVLLECEDNYTVDVSGRVVLSSKMS
jgi:hypothetical protein